jgi:hypothetical protein
MNEGVAGPRALEVTEREESSKALVDGLALVEQPIKKKLFQVGPGICWGGCFQGTHEMAVVLSGCSGDQATQNYKNPLLLQTCKNTVFYLFIYISCLGHCN